MVDADDAGNGGVVVAGSGATGDADTETDDPLKAEIMRATYRALIEQGYSDLTIQGIADEFPKSKSLLYYHYDGKDDLIASFLGFATDRFRREIEVEIDDPEAQLRALVDQLVPESLDEGEYRVQVALLELRSETPTTSGSGSSTRWSTTPSSLTSPTCSGAVSSRARSPPT